MEITFEQLPAAVGRLIGKLDNIEKILSERRPATSPPDQWLDLPGLCDYHPAKPAAQTVYEWVSNKKIPFHKNGKKLLFLKSEIDAWLLSGRRRTSVELLARSAEYLANKKG